MDFGMAGVAAITVICYLAAQLIKATPLDSRWLPVICGALGGVLGVVGMLLMPEFPAGDYLTAVAVGIVSGLAATGANQVYKQLSLQSRVNEFDEETNKGYDGEDGE